MNAAVSVVHRMKLVKNRIVIKTLPKGGGIWKNAEQKNDSNAYKKRKTKVFRIR